jgi:hypothetical protein
MSKIKNLLEFLEYEANSLTASEFTMMLDKKDIPWVWDDCDNMLDLNDGKSVIEVIEIGRLFWFEDGEFVDIFEYELKNN